MILIGNIFYLASQVSDSLSLCASGANSRRGLSLGACDNRCGLDVGNSGAGDRLSSDRLGLNRGFVEANHY